MFQSLIDDIRDEFNRGNSITRLIIANIAIFVLVNLIRVFTYGWAPHVYGYIEEYLALHADFWWDLVHPWVFITSLFMHVGFWHILWNMLFLFWFGRIVSDLIGDHKIIPIYFLGGIAGSIAFILSAQFSFFVPTGSIAMGASAAIMAIVVAAGALAPDYNMRLILIGNVKLKYIVLVLVLLDLFGTATMGNTGGHFAHLGGALMGWFYVVGLHNGRDIGLPIENFIEFLRDKWYGLFGSRPRVSRTRNRMSPVHVIHNSQESSGNIHIETEEDKLHQEEIDRILDKIRDSGYENLTDEEKETLFKASKQ